MEYEIQKVTREFSEEESYEIFTNQTTSSDKEHFFDADEAFEYEEFKNIDDTTICTQRRSSLVLEQTNEKFIEDEEEDYKDVYDYLLSQYTQKQINKMTVIEYREALYVCQEDYEQWRADKESRIAIKSEPISVAQMKIDSKEEESVASFVNGMQGSISAASDLVLRGFGKIVENEIAIVSQPVRMLLCGVQSNCICEKCFSLVTEALIYPSNIALIWNRVLDHHIVTGKDGSVLHVTDTRIESAQFLLVVVLGEFLRNDFDAVGVRKSLLNLLPKSFSIAITCFFPDNIPYEAEAQSNYIWEGLCSIIKTWNPMTTITRDDFHQAALFAKDMSALQSFTQRTVLFVTDLAIRLTKILTGATLNLNTEVATWIQKVEDLDLEPLTLERMGEPHGVFLSLPKRMASWPKLRQDVYSLYKEGRCLYHKYALIDSKSSEVNLLNKYTAQLNKVIAENTSSYLGSEGKNKPIFIVLYGDPGQGKTVCVDHLMRDLCAERGEAKYNPSLDKFCYNSLSEYFEGYNYQKVFEVSDFMQIREKQSRINELANILHISDESAYSLNIAFEKKGTVYFHSKYVILTTNLSPHDRIAAIRECIEYPDAFLRRINVMAKVENDVTKGKFNKDSMKFIVSEDPREKTAATLTMNWDEFVAHLSNVTDEVDEDSTNVRDLDDAFSDERIEKIRKLRTQKPAFSEPAILENSDFDLKVACINNIRGDCKGCEKFIRQHKGVVTGNWKLKTDHSGVVGNGHQCTVKCKYAVCQSMENVLLFDMGRANRMVKKALDGISPSTYETLIERKIYDELARELMIPIFTDDGLFYFPKEMRYKGYLAITIKREADDEGVVTMRATSKYNWYNLNYVAAFLENASHKMKNFKNMVYEMLNAVVTSRMGSIWHYIAPNRVKTKICNLVMKSKMDKVVEFFQNVVLPALVGLIGIIGAMKLWSWIFKKKPEELEPYYSGEECVASDTSGKGHRPRLPAKRRPKMRSQFEAEAQVKLRTFGGTVAASQLMSNAIDIATHNIKPNIGLVSTSVGTTNVVMLRDKLALVPEHVISDDEEDQVLMTFPGGRHFSFSYREVNAVYSSSNHFIIIDLSSISKYKRVASFSSIIRYMSKTASTEVPDGLLYVAAQSGVSLCSVMKLATDIRGPARAKVTTPSRKYEVPECYSYRCPTQSGDCGAPLIAVIDSQPVLVGFHIAMYMPEKLAFAGAVSKIWWEDSIMPELAAQAQVHPVATEFPSAVTYLDGPVPYTFQPRTSKLVHSDLWTEDCMFKPAPLKGWFDGKQPLQRAFEKSLRPIICPDEEEFYDAVEELSQVYERPEHSSREILTVEDAVFGIDDIPGMASSGGVGLPWSEKYVRQDLFNYDVGSISTELRDKCLENMHELKKGKRLNYIIVDMAKDEKLPVAKADQGKCRLFFILPIDVNVTCKQVFGRFAQFVINLHTVGPVKVGHSSEASEVRKLAHYLCLHRDDLKYLTPDTAASDRSIPYTIFMQVVEVANRWYDDDNDALRGILAESIFCCVHVLDGMKYEMRAGMPSGFYLTSVFNSLAYFIAYHSCMKQLRVVIVSIAVFGDDVVLAIDKREKVKEQQIVDKCKEYGLDITGVKKDEPLQFCGPSEVVFLQRSFVKRAGMWFSPMDLQRIQHQMMWYRRTKETKTWSKSRIHEEILRNAFHEFYQHGRVVFEEMKTKYKGVIEFYDLNLGDYTHHHECYTGGRNRHFILGDEESPTFGDHADYFAEAQGNNNKKNSKRSELNEQLDALDQNVRSDDSWDSSDDTVRKRVAARKTQFKSEDSDSDDVEVCQTNTNLDLLRKYKSKPLLEEVSMKKPAKRALAEGLDVTLKEVVAKNYDNREQKFVLWIAGLDKVLGCISDSGVPESARREAVKSFVQDGLYKPFLQRDKKTKPTEITIDYLMKLREEIVEMRSTHLGSKKGTALSSDSVKEESWWEWIKRKCSELWNFIKRKFGEFREWATATFTVSDCKLAKKYKQLLSTIEELKDGEEHVDELTDILEQIDNLRCAAIARAVELKKSMSEDVDGAKQSWYEWICTKLRDFARMLTMRSLCLKEKDLVNKLMETEVTKQNASSVIKNIAALEEVCVSLEERNEWTLGGNLAYATGRFVVGSLIFTGSLWGIEYLFPRAFSAVPILRMLVPSVVTSTTGSLAAVSGDFFLGVDEFSKKFSGVSICNFVLGGLGFMAYQHCLFLLGYGFTCNRWIALNPANTIVAPILEELGFEQPAHKVVFGLCEFLYYVCRGYSPWMRLPALLCHLGLAACAYKKLSLPKRIAIHSAFNVVVGQVEVCMRTQEEKENIKTLMLEYYKEHGTQRQLELVENASAGLFSDIKEGINWTSLGIGLLFAFGITGVTYMVRKSDEDDTVCKLVEKGTETEEKKIYEVEAQMDKNIVAETNIGEVEPTVKDVNLVRFVETAPLEVGCMPSNEYPIMDSGFEWKGLYCRELERVVKIADFPIDDAPMVTPYRFNGVLDLLNEKYIANRFYQAIGARFDIEYEIRLVVTKFHYGQIMAVIRPGLYQNQGDITSGFASSSKPEVDIYQKDWGGYDSVYTASQCDNVVIPLTHGPPVTLCAKWHYPFNWVYTRSPGADPTVAEITPKHRLNDIVRFGVLDIYNLTGAHPSGMTDPRICIWASFKNLRLFGYNAHIPKIYPMVMSYPTPISIGQGGEATDLAQDSWSGMINTVADTVHGFVRTFTSVLAFFGLSNPRREGGPVPMTVMQYPTATSYGDSPAVSLSYRMDDKQNSLLDEQGKNELLLATLAAKPTYYGCIYLTNVNRGAGFSISMNRTHRFGNGEIRSPAGFIKQFFKLARADIKLKFHFSASAIVNARVCINAVPSQGAVYDDTPATPYKVAAAPEISGDVIVDMDLPYMKQTQYSEDGPEWFITISLFSDIISTEETEVKPIPVTVWYSFPNAEFAIASVPQKDDHSTYLCYLPTYKARGDRRVSRSVRTAEAGPFGLEGGMVGDAPAKPAVAQSKMPMSGTTVHPNNHGLACSPTSVLHVIKRFSSVVGNGTKACSIRPMRPFYDSVNVGTSDKPYMLDYATGGTLHMFLLMYMYVHGGINIIHSNYKSKGRVGAVLSEAAFDAGDAQATPVVDISNMMISAGGYMFDRDDIGMMAHIPYRAKTPYCFVERPVFGFDDHTKKSREWMFNASLAQYPVLVDKGLTAVSAADDLEPFLFVGIPCTTTRNVT